MINNLNSRERFLVSGAAIFVAAVAIWFIFFDPYFNTIERLNRKISGLKRNLAEAGQMRDEIIQLRGQLDNGQRGVGEGRPLFSQVESITEQTGVREQLLSMRPQPATVQGEFRQQLVETRLERLSLGQLVRLLHAVEYRSGGVQVKSMRIKPRFDDRSTLDVNLVLMSLEKP